MAVRNLCLVFGDQLCRDLSSLCDFDRQKDLVWMAEVAQEATHVWCHKSRLVLFFSAMRHFRQELETAGLPVRYHELSADPGVDEGQDFASVLQRTIRELEPGRIIMTQPGDYRVQQAIKDTVRACKVELEIRPDAHFLCSPDQFAQWADGRKALVMEDFYRWMRKKHKILLDPVGKPVGGAWNFDKENRQSFGKSGPSELSQLRPYAPDRLTQAVIDLVNQRFATHPGSTESFCYPVTRSQALEALREFVSERLAGFGDFQDASWTDQSFLYHSRLSAVLNLHLLDPRELISAALEAYDRDRAPLNSVEGFVRQVLGWREFVRGVYWRYMPEYIERNALSCDDVDVPDFFWTGDTQMRCVSDSMRTVKTHAYAHHIQRLMILGLYAQLRGVHPRRFHDWHMAMYADAIDWVSLPNTLGMSQFGDGGVVGTKPYCASGNYIHKMSNYCRNCRFDYKQASGEAACPFTTLYWDFLDRHREQFKSNRRMVFQIKNLERKSAEDLEAIGRRKQEIVALEKAGLASQ